MIAAIGVVYAILRGLQSAAKDRDQNFSKMLTDLDQELQKIMDGEKELKSGTPDEDRCERFASDYLNIMDRLAYLRKLKKIDDDLIFYFDNYFAYGKLMLEWKYKVLKNEEGTKKRYSDTIWWVESSLNKNRLKEYAMTALPDDMQTLYEQNISQTKPTNQKPTGVLPKGF